ncbi:hypothetical protein LWE61_09510 [Sphingobium sufflavum]|uniref:hypothetical protein n=1 Tax=Sphingobium sufflavum TaxID=1129547 RepID=UPI001F2D3B13|nr:hypothetical protein [Sphingobium sufflavum]MCE7796793.1 hypothetical protein [Sphingobium sufflavum]
MQGIAARTGRSLIVFTWDGGSLDHIGLDADPRFDILLFDFTGRATPPDRDWPFLSHRTECKGDVLRVVSRYLRQQGGSPEYVALFDHDIRTSIGGINRLLDIARREKLDSFAPALSPDSYFSYPRFLACPQSSVRKTRWVEVMMPFYRTELFLAAGDFYERSITAYGIDSFVMPMFQKILGMDNVAIIDLVTVTHMHPVSSGSRCCSNGLTPYRERILARRQCLSWLKANRPDLIGTAWFYATFAPLDGPARFWLLRLGWPWHQAWRLLRSLPSPQRRTRAHALPPVTPS